MDTLTVAPGVNLARELDAFTKGRNRVTKTFVKWAVVNHPEWDWRNLAPYGYSYVSVNEAIRFGVTLQVRDPKTLNLVAVIYCDGGKAIVR